VNCGRGVRVACILVPVFYNGRCIPYLYLVLQVPYGTDSRLHKYSRILYLLEYIYAEPRASRPRPRPAAADGQPRAHALAHALADQAVPYLRSAAAVRPIR
jgi:hypothetical protein